MRLLVTGGAGFIGVNFINYMRNAHPDYRIICLDQLTYAGRRESLAPLFGTPDFCFYQADICDRSAVEEIFASVSPLNVQIPDFISASSSVMIVFCFLPKSSFAV